MPEGPSLSHVIAPEPSSSGLDPFGPLPVDQFPDAPGWLLPMVVVITAIAVAAILAMIGMSFVARRKAAAFRANASSHEWVDLREFDPRKDVRRQRSPKAIREDEEGD